MKGSDKSKPAIVVRENVELTETEKRIFATLMGTVRKYGLQTQLRVAGGWVRDKLIGQECHDIDIALDDIMGKEFAEHVHRYLISEGEETREAHVIQSNPEQSKHLETATMTVHNTSIDFVNLRAESYAEGSRIPEMQFGSAEDDAKRRDLTINSLFYNINAGSVEDLTGKGIADLQAGIIATPLPAMQTFLDDPLRVLRAVRFGSRFGFELHKDIQLAAQQEAVRSALDSKVSRERIGTEVGLMLRGRDPLLAMQHLAGLKLFPTVFSIPPSTAPALSGDFGRPCVASLEVVLSVADQYDPGQMDCVPFLLAALLLPLRHRTYTNGKGKKMELIQAVVGDGLKLKRAYGDRVSALHAAADEWQKTGGKLLMPPSDDKSIPLSADQRVLAGKMVRRMKDNWRHGLLLSSVLDHPATRPLAPGSVLGEAGEGGAERQRDQGMAKEAANLCQELEGIVVSQGLDKAWDIKPLLDGKAVIKTLGIKSGGAQIGQWMERAMEWQLAHPDGSIDACQAWLLEEYVKCT